MANPDIAAKARPPKGVSLEVAVKVASAATLARAIPSLLAIVAGALMPLWGVLALGWSVLAVVFVAVADGAAAGLFAWLRVRGARGGAAHEAASDRVLVREFVRTYFTVVAAMVMVAFMVFSGRLVRPGGEAPQEPYAAFATWQFWGVIAAAVAVRAFVYWWDWGRGGEAAFMPPAAVVSEPLRRLFVLQFGVLAAGLLVFWPLRSAAAGLVVLVGLKAAADLLLALLERLRAARIRAAAAAGP